MAKAKIVLPKGFKAYDGKGCPFHPDQTVETVTLTAVGPRAAEAMKSKLFDWEWAGGVPEVGDVVGYRDPRDR